MNPTLSRTSATRHLVNLGVLIPELLGFAKLISSSGSYPVLVSAVYDSDHFGYAIFNRDRKIEAFTTNEEFMPFASTKSNPKQQAQRWNELFGVDVNSDDVRSVTHESRVFSDGQLATLAGLLKIPLGQAAMTRDGLAGVDFIGFRKVQTASPAVVRQLLADRSRVGPPESLVGQDINLTFSLKGPHAELRNPSIEFYGTAAAAGLYEVSSTSGIWHCKLQHIKDGGSQHFTGDVAPQSRLSFGIEFPALNAEAFTIAPDKNVEILFMVSLKSVAVGSGELRVRIFPHGGRSELVELQPVYAARVDPDTGPINVPSLQDMRAR